MRRRTVVVGVAILFLSPASYALDPVGPPKALLGQGNWGLGAAATVCNTEKVDWGLLVQFSRGQSKEHNPPSVWASAAETQVQSLPVAAGPTYQVREDLAAYGGDYHQNEAHAGHEDLVAAQMFIDGILIYGEGTSTQDVTIYEPVILHCVYGLRCSTGATGSFNGIQIHNGWIDNSHSGADSRLVKLDGSNTTTTCNGVNFWGTLIQSSTVNTKIELLKVRECGFYGVYYDGTISADDIIIDANCVANSFIGGAGIDLQRWSDSGTNTLRITPTTVIANGDVNATTMNAVYDKIQTLVSPGIASHGYSAGHAAWTMSATEALATFFTVTDANAATTAVFPAAVPGKQFTVYNNSGQVITFKVSGQTGHATTARKYSIWTMNATDAILIYEQP